MTGGTDVYLITGFLGSGKTTFLNRIMRSFPPSCKVFVLMNEFGEVGVDGALIEGEDIRLLEISKGSIFCVCVKTDFIKGLYEIAQVSKPDVLLIESTGVADPSDMKKDLALPLFQGRFRFRHQFCVVDAENFREALAVFASMERQIASSDTFIINKIDRVPRQVVDEIRTIIGSLHPNPVFHETTYCDVPVGRFLSPARGPAGETAPMPEFPSADIDAIVDGLLEDPQRRMSRPDLLVSAAYRWTGGTYEEFEKEIRRRSDGLVRAKGFLDVAGEVCLFNYTFGQTRKDLLPQSAGRIKHRNVVVLIGHPQAMERIDAAVSSGEWPHMAAYQA